MDTTYMREFLVLAKHLNYTTAAQALYISQPTLSRHISALEDELGARLLNRTRHAVSLTSSGEAAMAAFSTVVQNCDDLLGQIGEITYETTMGLHLGMVYFGISAFYGGHLMDAFSSRYPEVNLSTITSNSSRIYESLYRRTIDVALAVSSTSFEDVEIGKAVVTTIPLYLVVHEDHPLAKRDSVKPQELAHEKITLPHIPIEKMNHIEKLFSSKGVKLGNLEYASDIDSMLSAMSVNGRAHIGTKLLTAMPGLDFIYVPIEDESFEEDVSLLYLKENKNPNIARLIDCVNDSGSMHARFAKDEEARSRM